MKTHTAPVSRLLKLSAFLLWAPLVTCFGADTNSNASGSAPVSVEQPQAAAVTAPVKLPYGVDDVLKLSRAQMSEDIILNYVRTSGTIYNLTPKEIVYLRDQGVSEKVLNAMLSQRARVEMASQNAVPAAPAPNAAPAETSLPPDYAPAPADTAVQAPLTPPASSVYVIPYPAARYAYYGSYGYYPYYPYSYGYYGPSVSFGFRFGGYGGFHGGYHGGYHGGHGSFGGHGGHHR